MTLDIQTMLVATMGSLLGLSIAMPLIMGWRVSLSARYAQATVMAQTLAWLFILLSPLWQDRLMSSLSMAFMAAGLVCQWRALQGWLGPRPGRRTMLALAVLMPLGYALGYSSYAFRVGWANFGLAGQMFTICLALAWPSPGASRRWRSMMVVCMLALAVVTVWRGVLGAFYTADYPYFRAPHPVNLASALIHNITVVLSTLGLLVAWREEAERDLQVQARTDVLTGLLNRRAFTHEASEAIGDALRHPQPMSLLLLDLDDFKRINDEHGHALGDQALQVVARTLMAERRRGDLVGRYGGEEFCVLLRHADVDSALAFDARLREVLRHATRGQLGFPIDFSAGISAWQADEADLDAWLRRADRAMYQAKSEGKGRPTVL